MFKSKLQGFYKIISKIITCFTSTCTTKPHLILNGTLTISKPYLFEISHKILSIDQYNQTYTSYPLYYH